MRIYCSNFKRVCIFKVNRLHLHPKRDKTMDNSDNSKEDSKEDPKQSKDTPYKAHLFICTRSREQPKACCNSKGSEELRKKVKSLAKEKWGKSVRINTSGCLDFCSKGITAVLYPQNKWFYHLTINDENILIDAIEKALDEETVT